MIAEMLDLESCRVCLTRIESQLINLDELYDRFQGSFGISFDNGLVLTGSMIDLKLYAHWQLSKCESSGGDEKSWQPWELQFYEFWKAFYNSVVEAKSQKSFEDCWMEAWREHKFVGLRGCL